MPLSGNNFSANATSKLIFKANRVQKSKMQYFENQGRLAHLPQPELPEAEPEAKAYCYSFLKNSVPGR